MSHDNFYSKHIYENICNTVELKRCNLLIYQFEFL